MPSTIWRLVLPVALVFGTAACGGTTPAVAPSISAAANDPAAGGTAPAPATGAPGLRPGIETPGEARYSCGGPPGFAPSLFDQPATAELDQHPSAAALRAAIAQVGLDIDFLPESGYWLVSRDERTAEFIALGGDMGYSQASVANEGYGWKIAGWGDCRPTIVLADRSVATWTLDPDVPAPGPGSTTFTALVAERTCTGGEAMGGRLQAPWITYTERSILVVFAATPLPEGFHTCPGNPPTRVLIALTEPLGDRDLLDAAFFPPAEPTPEPS